MALEHRKIYVIDNAQSPVAKDMILAEMDEVKSYVEDNLK